MMVSWWWVLVRLRLAGVRGLLVTWELAGLLIGGLLRAMVGLCTLVLRPRWLLRRLRWLGRLLLTSVRTNTLIRLDFPLKKPTAIFKPIAIFSSVALRQSDKITCSLDVYKQDIPL